MITINGETYMTEIQWAKKKRAILKRQREKGVYREWRATPGMVWAIFYRENQTRPFNKKELAKLKRERKLLREERKKRKEEERLRLEEAEKNREQTAWQWLAYEQRIPVDAAVAIEYHPTWKEPGGFGNPLYVRRTSEKAWYYYQKKDTYVVEDSIYELLKALYIQKFGGWNYIDLERTDYDGHKWW